MYNYQWKPEIKIIISIVIVVCCYYYYDSCGTLQKKYPD